MSTRVECTECEWRGTENDLHYKKLKPWATSEDPICPICGGPVTYGTPLPERPTEHSEIAKLIWSKLTYTLCKIDDKDWTLIEIKDVWGLIKELEYKLSIWTDLIKPATIRYASQNNENNQEQKEKQQTNSLSISNESSTTITDGKEHSDSGIQNQEQKDDLASLSGILQFITREDCPYAICYGEERPFSTVDNDFSINDIIDEYLKSL